MHIAHARECTARTLESAQRARSGVHSAHTQVHSAHAWVHSAHAWVRMARCIFESRPALIPHQINDTMGHSHSLVEIEHPLVPDQPLEDFVSGVNTKTCEFLQSWKKGDITSPLHYWSAREQTGEDKGENKGGHLAHTFVGSHKMVTPPKGHYIVLGRHQSAGKDVGSFWHTRPHLASPITLSHKMDLGILDEYGNTGQHMIWIVVPHGFRLFTGITASQTGIFGQWRPGGGTQFWIPQAVAQALYRATQTLLNGQSTEHLKLAGFNLAGYKAACLQARKVQVEWWKGYRRYGKGSTIGFVTKISKEERNKQFKEVHAEAEALHHANLVSQMESLNKTLKQNMAKEEDPICSKCGYRASEHPVKLT